jgi:NADPH:quinone reductase-like Zn-dependent oxidoreductase
MGWGPDHGRARFAPQTKPQIARLVELWKGGKISPTIHARYPLERIVEAAADIQERRNIGRVVVHP